MSHGSCVRLAPAQCLITVFVVHGQPDVIGALAFEVLGLDAPRANVALLGVLIMFGLAAMRPVTPE